MERPDKKVGRREPPPKLYRIGEVVRYSGLSRQTVHNYTAMGLISESAWTEGGHRLYDGSVFERIERIERLKETRTLREVARVLAEAEDGSAEVSVGGVAGGGGLSLGGSIASAGEPSGSEGD